MTTHERQETFEVVDGHLIRKVVPIRGTPYEHRCRREAFERVVQAAQELDEVGLTLLELADRAGTSSTQSAVALAFLKERGCVVTRYRRTYPASTFLFEDAMTEFCALAEKS